MALNLQKERVRAKLSVLELAREIGVTDTCIRDIESGKRRLSLLRLPAFCQALDLDLGEVLREALAAGPVRLDLSVFPKAEREAIAAALQQALAKWAEKDAA